MGAVENNLMVLPVQTCASAGDEPRVSCIIYNMTNLNAVTRRAYNINLPMSVPCQTLIDDIKSKYEYLPAEFCVMYERPTEGETSESVKLNNYAEKPIGEVCLHCGDGGRNTFFVYDSDPSSTKYENWDEFSAKLKSTRSNAICDSTDHSSIISQVSSVEAGYSNKDSYDACSGPSSSGNYSFSLNALPKSDSGYVGLVNQAMTCYLNSLLQTLYMTPEFRNAVYRWKFNRVDTDAAVSIPYQLQRLFLQLQTSNKRAIETTDITRSFGWDSSEAWHQHDIQELCRVMFDALERTWKSTDQENLINELYQGRMKDYVKCLECGSVSARPDTYLDLPLVIRPFGSEVGYKSVEQALKAFEEPEILEGSNQYFCEKCGRHCNAHKGLRIVSHPYILTLHLKRFGFDHCTYQRFKLNDRMTFPEVLKLERFADESEVSDRKSESKEEKSRDGVSENEAAADVNSQRHEDMIEDEGIDTEENLCNLDNKTVSDHEAETNKAPIQQVTYQYQLFSIMVHSGSAAGGHYYAYIRSFMDGQWYSFNDQHVFKISEEDIERTFGGSSGSSLSYSTYASSTNAYMLLYRLIDPARNKDFIDEAEFPEHLREEVISIQKKEEEELQQQEIDRNTCKIKLFAYDSSLEKYTDHRFEVHRSKTLAEATELAWKQAELADVPLDCVRLVKYDSTREYIEQSFEGEEETTIGVIFGGVKSSYHFDLLLETKDPNDAFVAHFRGGVMVRLLMVDLLHEVIQPPKVVRILPGRTVGELMQLTCQVFDVSADTTTLVLDRGYTNFWPLLDLDKTLSEEAFDKINTVFLECSGVEPYDGYFPATKFYKILDRVANTISLTIALPSVSEIARMHASLLRTYFLNQPSDQRNSDNLSMNRAEARPVDEKSGDVDEGIGESETDLHYQPCIGDVQSEMDLSAFGMGANEVLSRTSDWCSSICSNELLHDVSESLGGMTEGPSERETRTSAGKVDVKNDVPSAQLREAPVGMEAYTSIVKNSMRTANDDSNDVEAPWDSRPTCRSSDNNGTCGGHDNEEFKHEANDVPYNADVQAASSNAGLQSEAESSVSFSLSCVQCDNSVPSCELDSATCLHEKYDRLSPVDLRETSDVTLDADALTSMHSFDGGDNDDYLSDVPTPRVSSNGSNSPELENEKELSCPKESEENWDLEEPSIFQQENNFSYFRVVREINGLFERSLTVEVDRRMSIGRLKTHLEPYMGTSSENFRVFRFCATSPDIEMTKLYEQVLTFGNGGKLVIKLGRALKPGEHKVFVYQLLVHNTEPIKFLFEVIVPRGVSLNDLKLGILNELQVQFNTDISLERCRLRKKIWKNPGGIFVNDVMMEDLFRDPINIEVLLEILEEGPDRMEATEDITLLQIYVRRWRPATYQLDPVQELIVSNWTLPNIRKELSLLSGLKEEDISIAKARGQFPCNIPVLDIEKEMQWDPSVSDITVFPMVVTDDGAVLFYKDKTELLADLTDEQKKDVQEKENARLQKMKPTVKIPNKAERALKIYTVSDHPDGRANSRPV